LGRIDGNVDTDFADATIAGAGAATGVPLSRTALVGFAAGLAFSSCFTLFVCRATTGESAGVFVSATGERYAVAGSSLADAVAPARPFVGATRSIGDGEVRIASELPRCKIP